MDPGTSMHNFCDVFGVCVIKKYMLGVGDTVKNFVSSAALTMLCWCDNPIKLKHGPNLCRSASNIPTTICVARPEQPARHRRVCGSGCCHTLSNVSRDDRVSETEARGQRYVRIALSPIISLFVADAAFSLTFKMRGFRLNKKHLT